MKLKNIEIKNDVLFTDLNIDFEINFGKIAKTIIFSGNNGIGKTRLLKFLSFDELFIETQYSLNPNLKLKYTFKAENDDNFFLVLEKDGILTKIKENNNEKNCFQLIEIERILSKDNNFMSTKIKWIFQNVITKEIKEFNNEPYDIQVNINAALLYCSDYFKMIFRKDNDINNFIETIYKNSEKQTIDLLHKNDFKVRKECEIFQDWRSFVKSFNEIFKTENLKISKWSYEKQTFILKKNNQEFDMNNASNGEKQVIYLLTWLVQQNNFNHFLFDEIELFLHPVWQIQLLPEIRNLAKEKQIFLTTHSPFIQSSRNKDDDLFFTGKRTSNGKIIFSRNQYYGINEIKKLSFVDILEEDYINIIVSGPLDKFYFEQVIETWSDEFKNNINITHPYMYPNDDNSSGGDSNQLNMHILCLPIIQENFNYKIIFVYDCDFEHKNEFNQSKKIKNDSTLNQCFSNSSIKLNANKSTKLIINKTEIKGIENLLNISEELKADEIFLKCDKREIKKNLKCLIKDKTTKEKKDILKNLKEELSRIIEKVIN